MISIRSSINLKICLLVLGSTCLVLALVLERSYSNSRELIRQEAENGARNLTASLANQIEQEFLVVAQAARDLALFLESSDWNQENLLDHISRMVRQNEEIFGSTVAFLPFAYRPDIRGYAPYFYKSKGGVAFEQLGKASYDYFDHDWFRITSQRKKAVWLDPYFDEGGGNVLMTTFACPMFGPRTTGSGRELKAIVTADISLKQLNDLVNGKKVYETGFCFVVSDKGTFVTHRSPERVMRMSVFDAADEQKHPRAKEIARALLTEESGFYDIGAAFTGKPSFLAFTHIRPPGWTLVAVLPKAELFAKVSDLHHKIVLIGAVGILLLLVAATLVARSISKPLRRMAKETVKVAEGDLDIDLSDVRSKDEVGQLARAFTRMTEGLKDRDRIKDTFGRYLTQEVVKRLLESKDGLKLGVEVREISIMMSDLRGFTALTATMSPEQVITFLNRYLGKMVEIILDHRGIIDEIIGDGILAFFGAPEKLENHPELAVACALKMQAAMEEINVQNEEDGLPHLEMGVAVNTGEVVVGNIGSEKRAKYGAVGSQVNFTGRVESFTVGGQVLISRGTYEKVSDKVDVRDVLQVEMKGVPGKVSLYDARGIKGDYGISLQDRDESMTKLSTEIEVRVFGMEQKILDQKGRKAAITHASLTSARLRFEGPVTQWEDLRMILEDYASKAPAGEIYGKVVSVKSEGEGSEAVLRFTSVSSDGYKTLRESIGNDITT